MFGRSKIFSRAFITPQGRTNRNVKGIEVHVQEKSPRTRKIEDKKDPASGMAENKLQQTGNSLLSPIHISNGECLHEKILMK